MKKIFLFLFVSIFCIGLGQADGLKYSKSECEVIVYLIENPLMISYESDNESDDSKTRSLGYESDESNLDTKNRAGVQLEHSLFVCDRKNKFCDSSRVSEDYWNRYFDKVICVYEQKYDIYLEKDYYMPNGYRGSRTLCAVFFSALQNEDLDIAFDILLDLRYNFSKKIFKNFVLNFNHQGQTALQLLLSCSNLELFPDVVQLLLSSLSNKEAKQYFSYTFKNESIQSFDVWHCSVSKSYIRFYLKRQMQNILTA